MKENNIILEKTFAFSLSIISLYSQLKNDKEYVLSKQLLRAGTSIGANAEEAIAAQSKRDFINKMSIAAKEARETRYWLRLLDKSQLVKHDYATYLNSVDEILRIITAIVKTSQESLNVTEKINDN